MLQISPACDQALMRKGQFTFHMVSCGGGKDVCTAPNGSLSFVSDMKTKRGGEKSSNSNRLAGWICEIFQVEQGMLTKVSLTEKKHPGCPCF